MHFVEKYNGLNEFFKKSYICLFCYLTVSFHAYSQPREMLNVPETYPKPEWLHSLNWSSPNMFYFDSVVNEWSDKIKHNSKNFQSEDNPYLNAYQRWRMHIEPLIGQNGLLTNIDNGQSMINSDQFLQKANMGKSNKAEYGNWKSIGPANTFAGGKSVPWQANIFTFAIDRNDPNIAYCGTESGAIFKSTNKGISWVSVADNIYFPNSSITGLALSKQKPGTLYAFASSLLKSTDAASSWNTLSSYKGGFTEDIEVNQFTDRIYVANDTGILISDDGGAAWKYAAGSKVGRIYDIVISSDDAKIVFASGATSQGNLVLLKSNDGGDTFVEKTATLSQLQNKGSRMAVTAANANVVYCLILGKDYPSLFKSVDKGETWSLSVASSTSGLGGSNVSVGLGMSNGQGFYDMDLSVSDKNPNEVIVATTTAYKSTDGGFNFSPLGGYVGQFNIHPDIQVIKTFGNDTYICTDGGVNYSSDFFTSLNYYEARIQGLASCEFWGFGQGWDEDIVVGGRYHNGNTALSEMYGSGNSLRLGGGEDATGHVFHGLGSTVGFRDIGTLKLPSSISGNAISAEIRNTKWPTEDFYGQFSSRLLIDPRYKNVYYVGNGKNLLRSKDFGSNYDTLATFKSNVWRFDISRTNPMVFYLMSTDSIYNSNDGGKNWNKLNLPIGVTYSFYNSDITVNPSDEKKVYLSMATNSNASNKVFMSKDGGQTWSNLTGSVLSGKSVAYLQSDGTIQDGVYAITNFPGRVYYRNASMLDWIDFNNGLPTNITARQGGIIFFRDNKIRICGNRGIWESPLYMDAEPLAQPMSDKESINCSKDTVSFSDYSILKYAGAKWVWEFPGATYVANQFSKNPKVVYGSPGSYDVYLNVQDILGRKSSKLIKNMINFNQENCAPDTLAGLALRASLDSTVLNIGKANINSNSFTITCWIKPSGLQRSFAQLVSHDPYPGAVYGFGLGFSFKGYTPNLNLCYTDQTVGYGNGSSLIADTSTWNFVALVYEPNGVKIYLNGKSEIVNNRKMPIIDLSQSPFYINKDVHNQGGYYKGIIDEVKIYNYNLTETELREKMHLIQVNGLSEKGLLKYVQFNKYSSNTVYELVNGSQISVLSKFIVKSTAPIGSGKVYRIPVVNGSGNFSFINSGLNMSFKVPGTYPNGELVAFRLNVKPDFYPYSATQKFIGDYWIFNNYGLNKSFTGLDSLCFLNLQIQNPTHLKSDYTLYKRLATGSDSTWVPVQSSANTFVYNSLQSNYLTYNVNGIVSQDAQLLILDNSYVDTSIQVIAKTIPCQGDTITLMASGNLKYKWMKDGQILPNETTQKLNVLKSGIYRAVVSNSNGFTDTSRMIQVDISALPTVPAVDLINLCQVNRMVDLMVDSLPSHSINWFLDSSSTSQKLATPPAVSASVAGNAAFYYISQKSKITGCESKRIKLTVRVSPVPPAPAVTDSSACKNSIAFALSATPTAGNSTQWYGMDSLSVIATSVAPIVNTSQTGVFKYYVAQKSSFGCVGPKTSISFLVKELPPTPTVADVKYCQNAAASALNVTPSTGNSILWYTSINAGVSSTVAPTPSTQTAGTTIFFLSQKNTSTGCVSLRSSINITINPIPSPPVTNDLTVCQSSMATNLSAISTAGHTLNWYGNSNVGGTSTITSPVTVTSLPGAVDYYVSQTNAATGCESVRSKLSFTVIKTPERPIISRDGNGNLVSSYPSGNQWYREGVLIQGETNQSFKPIDAALYSVSSRQNGCISTVSENYYYLATALTNFSNGQFIHLYPNPVSDLLKINIHLNSNAQLNILMFDESGKKIGIWNKRGSFQINMSNFSSGLYHFIFKKADGSTIYTTSILKAK